MFPSFGYPFHIQHLQSLKDNLITSNVNPPLFLWNNISKNNWFIPTVRERENLSSTASIFQPVLEIRKNSNCSNKVWALRLLFFFGHF